MSGICDTCGGEDKYMQVCTGVLKVLGLRWKVKNKMVVKEIVREGVHSINPLKTKRRLVYLKTQSVPRCKHFLSRL